MTRPRQPRACPVCARTLHPGELLHLDLDRPVTDLHRVACLPCRAALTSPPGEDPSPRPDRLPLRSAQACAATFRESVPTDVSSVNYPERTHR